MKLRRHHNNKGYRMIRKGTAAKQMKRLAIKMKVKFSQK